MLYFIVFGFICGLFVPITASRFGKILPADPGAVVYTLFHMPRFPKTKSKTKKRRLQKKWIKMLKFSLFWAILLSALFGFTYQYGDLENILWFCAFYVMVALLIAVDQQYFLLPDFFTIPLLIAGFGFAVCTGEITPADSFIGAVYAYAISLFSVLLMRCFKSNAEFGAGDFKMLAALGAWFGMISFNYILLLSFVFFATWGIIRHQKIGALGPSLGFASLIVMLFTYIK